tara:strand:- start:766 stop:1317 length:552 start_codon:yes stop_codon:yes gene_type:complete
MKCFKRFFCCSARKNKGVYVLKLTNNKYYIGESNDIDKRVWVHMNKAGSAWTKKYDVLKREETITNPQDAFWELNETLEQMKLHGIDNVRGSMFTNPYELSMNEKISAAQLVCEKYNLCRKCGGSDHFITQCKGNEMADWVSNFGGQLEITNKKECIICQTDISTKPSNYRYCNKCFRTHRRY